MRKVFWDDPYQQCLETTVAQVDGNVVVFAETIGFSECGGQESDAVTVNDIKALSSHMETCAPFLIYYTFPEGHGFVPGTRVTMKIDWLRRNRLMRLHFMCELILVLMNRFVNNTPEGVELKPEEIDTMIKKKGAHIAESGARVDFECNVNIAVYFPKLLKEYEKIIAADLSIEKGFLDETHQMRYWRLPNIATVLCGGTHVHSTGEVGAIELKRDRANKGVERIRIYLKSESGAKS